MTGLEGPKLLFSFVTELMETHLLITTSQPSPPLPTWVLPCHSHGKLNCLVKSQVNRDNLCLCSEPERGSILWIIQLSPLKGNHLHHQPNSWVAGWSEPQNRCKSSTQQPPRLKTEVQAYFKTWLWKILSGWRDSGTLGLSHFVKRWSERLYFLPASYNNRW